MSKGGVFHSKRFGVRIAFPEGSAWRIDDRSHPELRAKHDKLGEVWLEMIAEPSPMSSGKCEDALFQRGDIAVKKLRDPITPPVTLENEQVERPRGFETRVRAVVEVGKKGEPFVGHLVAIGGAPRRCFFFHFFASTENERDLGERLARARTEIFDRIDLPEFGTIPKEHLP